MKINGNLIFLFKQTFIISPFFFRTVLHHACSQGCVGAVKFLLSIGADLLAEDDQGKNAFDLAIINGKVEPFLYIFIYLINNQ